ncbi:hypothetical protein [Phenylobacterium sp.]|jgi:hypothetical protein|uniref:hypothetical protein n=1 Tax=Phenylobacterium sp. TaxID=1871053 RepID=UPI002F3F58F3
MRRLSRVALMSAAALAVPSAAAAADEEIQVYMDEIGPVHRPGLDVHLNYVPSGRAAADYAGEQASESRIRITPEWSYSLSETTELGLYLPLMTIDRRGKFEAGGIKGRIKWIAPRPATQDWFWGLNFELGRVRHDLDINPWNAELKGIWGVRKGPWTMAANLNVDWAVSGPEHSPVDFQVATKVAYKLDAATALGVESYNGLGGGRGFGRVSQSDHQTFLERVAV